MVTQAVNFSVVFPPPLPFTQWLITSQVIPIFTKHALIVVLKNMGVFLFSFSFSTQSMAAAFVPTLKNQFDIKFYGIVHCCYVVSDNLFKLNVYIYCTTILQI